MYILYVCIYAVYVYMCMYVCIYIYIYVCVCVCVCAYVYVYVYVYIYIYIYIYIHLTIILGWSIFWGGYDFANIVQFYNVNTGPHQLRCNLYRV